MGDWIKNPNVNGYGNCENSRCCGSHCNNQDVAIACAQGGWKCRGGQPCAIEVEPLPVVEEVKEKEPVANWREHEAPASKDKVEVGHG